MSGHCRPCLCRTRRVRALLTGTHRVRCGKYCHSIAGVVVFADRGALKSFAVHDWSTQYRSVIPMQTIERRDVSGDVRNGADSGPAEGATDV
ncbi:hypothetical protein HISP_02021 [Haloarcula hispanica N601]|uniref:Uncharacterized protein n=2 Tax=Haloarcula hispanica TaxID=51589 RepID=W0GI15_HALHI|nr:hypothetical protein HAH_0386 [Haloarcula hispanica ATCC 33960]AHF55856.1 hypothetical protein HISP_02021 [Haloarcula hispanica N601]